MAPTVLSLFSGYGGLELGLHAALGGGRTVGYVERESFAAAILLARMEEQTLEPAPVWCGDIHDLDPAPFRGVDWVTGGFPCQPFSTAGKREGQADERWLWESGIVPLLREVQPRWCLFENVPGLVRLGLGPVLRDLAVLGFDVEWGVFKASDVGASHRRERVFILARRVADTPGEPRLQVPQTGRADGAQGDDASGASGELADRTSHGREGGVAQREVQRYEPTGIHTQLADAERRGPQGGAEQRTGPRTVIPPKRGRPFFAPGPADLDVWARVLAQAPQVEPSLCRMADGSAGWLEYRQDRLRALGNGVVPLQAAVAVRVLAERAGWDLRG